MPYSSVHEPARSAAMPPGVEMQPREFSFRDLDAIPQYWCSNNPGVTHFENAFSILIPPGERFFIDSVKHYEDKVAGTEGEELVRAFVQQESLHGEAHDRFNSTWTRFGIDVASEQRYAEKAFRRVKRICPPIIQLGITVFSEHLTAVGAHSLLNDPAAEEEIEPQMLEFWRWHAAEELEHKAVAFDLFHQVGGNYATRMLSVLATASLLAVPMVRIARSMMKQDPHEPTKAERREAARLQRRAFGDQIKLFAMYFKPSFHPWQIDDTEMLQQWYESSGASDAKVAQSA